MRTKAFSTLALAAVLLASPSFAKERRHTPRRSERPRAEAVRRSERLHAQGVRRTERTRPQAERITNGPIVEGTGSTWAVIAWTTNTGGSSVVRYGTEPGDLGRRAQSPYSRNRNHRVRLTSLRPHTRYFFEVVSGQGEGTGTQDARKGEFTTR